MATTHTFQTEGVLSLEEIRAFTVERVEAITNPAISNLEVPGLKSWEHDYKARPHRRFKVTIKMVVEELPVDFKGILTAELEAKREAERQAAEAERIANLPGVTGEINVATTAVS